MSVSPEPKMRYTYKVTVAGIWCGTRLFQGRDEKLLRHSFFSLPEKSSNIPGGPNNLPKNTRMIFHGLLLLLNRGQFFFSEDAGLSLRRPHANL
jgi:hypothetical protein